jgi:hypothetical protein
VWHHGSPGRAVLDAPSPPFRAGRYHRAGGRPTWYGSSTEDAAWREFGRSLPEGVDPSQFKRRIGRVDFDLIALDLTSPELQTALGINPEDLTSNDLTVCQTLADLAADSGFDALLAPSAARRGNETLAVFGPAIRAGALKVSDVGIRPARPIDG